MDRKLYELARAEIRRAALRYFAKAGTEEHGEIFELALCDYLSEWFAGVVDPPGPVEDAENCRDWDEAIRQTQIDLELLGDGTDPGTAT